MAYAALVSLAQTLDQILNHHRCCSIPLICEDQLFESLREKLSFLQAFLEDYAQIGGEAVEGLEGRIRAVAYRAEDIIESHVSDQISSEDNCCMRYMDLELQNSEKNEGDLQKVLELLDYIIEQVMSIQKSIKVEDLQGSYTSVPASSGGAPNDGNKMVGFDEDIVALKARLCGESFKLQVISIVGMGGIGKTTLAKNIFNDPLVAYHFHTRVWITVSQDYHLREVLLALVASLTDQETMDLSKRMNDELAECVYKNLKGKTYFIVMDDMWSTKTWDDLRRFFPNDNNGSRVLLTTRLSDVAVYASSSPLHHMHFLDEEWSWNLLRDKVFGQQRCPPKLERVGRTIAKRCRGLPLAIAMVAGILTKMDRTRYHWEKIVENISGVVATYDEHFSNILTLSYNRLPCHLKACFLYIGGFPEDYNIPVSKLTKLWIAEGFLKLNGSKSLEELAEEYLEDLVKRNLVLIVEKRSNGKIKFCGVHDLLRDLCIQKAQEEEFLHATNSSTRGIQHQRRLSIHSQIYGNDVDKFSCASFIRSFLYFPWYIASLSFLQGYRLLRVLDLITTRSDTIQPEITQLFHLRFLALSLIAAEFCSELIIPPSISKLQNLQTLMIRIYGCENIDDLQLPPIEMMPSEIWEMPQLRHLIFFQRDKLPIPLVVAPSGGQVLENLQTLCVNNFRCTSNAIEMIPNLKKLKVYYFDSFREAWAKYCLNNLVHLCQLETLNLMFMYPRRYTSDPFLAFPLGLKKLTLSTCELPWDDMAVIRSLPNLEVLKLKDDAFIGAEWECSDGEFPRLKFLLMDGLNLICWRVESTHFPCLERLIITRCWKLEEIPCEIGEISTLQLIEVVRASKSAANSAVSIQEEQRDLGNDVLQVRIRDREEEY
ncbi:putative late blight resistance proteinR1A-10 [Sesamum alatum]|uniref:Late blight resistance proteinR1A-10 n=1 Tax=Sesamum alatum TaxID=300844 RepID=A0AAE1XLS8_9LAMI|nr:putative late blight resistance proteinR1A-10 [Sesamum alatum]